MVAAAWVGISEREFAIAVAQELGVEFADRVQVPALAELSTDMGGMLNMLRKVGAVPLTRDGQVVAFVAIDPAELRNLPIYDGSQSVAISTWSEISKALDQAERALNEEQVLRDQTALKERSKLIASIIEALMREAAAHGSTSVEVLRLDGRGRYQFVTPDGRQGAGSIRADVLGDLFSYLQLFYQAGYLSPKRGEVLIRPIGQESAVRLSWAQPISKLPEATLALDLRTDRSSDDPHSQERGKEDKTPSETSPDLQSTAKEIDGPPSSSSQVRVPILVVDDNPMFCRVLERLLRRDGFEPQFAANGEEALSLLSGFKSYAPKAIVSDLHMPVMNGEEFLRKVRSNTAFAAVPFIMLTSDEDVNAEVSLLARGADAFVSKNRDPRVLCAHIRRLTRSDSILEAA